MNTTNAMIAGQQADADQGEDVDVTLTGRLERLTDGARQACNDTAKINIEMPLPTPRSVICSPSHIMNMAPATKVVTAT